MPIKLTQKAIDHTKEMMTKQEFTPPGMRIAVVGGGCSGYSYEVKWGDPKPFDKTYEFDGLKVFVDQASMLYLDGTQIDWVETTMAAGYDFKNPNSVSTCGCGSSFRV